MGAFAESRRAIENEGVYIGGWSIKNAFIPDKTRGKYPHRSHLKDVHTTASHHDK